MQGDEAFDVGEDATLADVDRASRGEGEIGEREPAALAQKASAESGREQLELRIPHRDLLGYVALIVRWADGVRLSAREAGEWLLAVVRQHSIGRESSRGYALRRLVGQPP